MAHDHGVFPVVAEPVAELLPELVGFAVRPETREAAVGRDAGFTETILQWFPEALQNPLFERTRRKAGQWIQGSHPAASMMAGEVIDDGFPDHGENMDVLMAIHEIRWSAEMTDKFLPLRFEGPADPTRVELTRHRGRHHP